MNSRQRVIAALRFEGPDRIPRDIWAMPWVTHERSQEFQALLDEFPMDFSTAPAVYPPDQPRMPAYTQPGGYVDEWGCTWQVKEPGVTGEVVVPPLADWEDFSSFNPPWDYLAQRSLEGVDAFCREQETFVLSEWTARPFERMQFLRGAQALYIDLATQEPGFQLLLEMVHAFFLEDIRQWCGTAVDGIVISDDWGSNDRLLISPSTWRKIFKPLYLEYASLIHAAGKFVFFHSDGFIEPILDDLVFGIGIDAINMQLNVMDIHKLAQKYTGRVTLWGEVDRQHILPFGSPGDVHRYVNELRQHFGGEQGGMIAHCVWNSDNHFDNIRAVFQAFSKD
jgi:uroporphyrinogen decarboxylase